MEAKKAYIYWTRRKPKPFITGLEYFPHIVRADDINKEHWSVRFFITEENKENEGHIELKMLVDNDACLAFFETLKPGTKFYLFEGPYKVAQGYFL